MRLPTSDLFPTLFLALKFSIVTVLTRVTRLNRPIARYRALKRAIGR